MTFMSDSSPLPKTRTPIQSRIVRVLISQRFAAGHLHHNRWLGDLFNGGGAAERRSLVKLHGKLTT